MISIEIKEKLEFTLDVDTIDYYNAMPLLNAINTEIEKYQKRVVINLKNVSFIDSSGIAMLAGLTKRYTGSRGNLVLSNVSQELKKMFKTMNLDGFFKLR